jgi:propionyl-CoA carboxylase alpha chain
VAALWVQGVNRSEATVLATVPSGWQNGRMPDQRVTLDHGEGRTAVRYHSRRDGSFCFDDGSVARVHHWSEQGMDVEIAGRRTRTLVTRAGAQLVVQCGDGDVVFREQPRFVLPGAEQDEGGFVARMPGKVIELRVKVGDTVADGDTVLVLEAMKMEHPMRASEDGVVLEVRVEEGEQVEAGTLLLVVETVDEQQGEK